MKRSIAFLVYYVGALLALKGFVEVLAHGSFPALFFAPVTLLAMWWISAGIGVRLGVTPPDFFGSIADFFDAGDQAGDPASDRPRSTS